MITRNMLLSLCFAVCLAGCLAPLPLGSLLVNIFLRHCFNSNFFFSLVFGLGLQITGFSSNFATLVLYHVILAFLCPFHIFLFHYTVR